MTDPVAAPVANGTDDSIRNDFLQGRAYAQGAADPWAEINKALAQQAPATPAAAPPAGQPRAMPTGNDPFRLEDILAAETASNPSGALSDIGRGVRGALPAIARGASGAVQNTFHVADEFATWLNTHVADLTIPVPSWVPDWMQNPARSVADTAGAVHDAIPERDSFTGKTIEFAAQWLTSAAMVGKVADAAGMAPGVLRNVLTYFGAGATGFDPRERRLSSLIQDVAPNPVTDFLQAKQDDPELLARLKSGLENAGLGAAMDGVIAALKLLRSARMGPEGAPIDAEVHAQAPDASAPGAEPAPPAASGEAVAGSGDMAATPVAEAPPPAPARPAPVEVTGDVKAAAQAYLDGTPGPNPVRINIAQVQGGDDIRAVVEHIASQIPDSGPVTHEMTVAMADSLGLSADDFLAGYQGKSLNAPEIVAMKMATDDVALQVFDAAAKLRAAGGAPDAMAEFNQAYAVGLEMGKYFLGGASDAGRNLNAFGIAERRGSPQMRALLASARMVQQGMETGQAAQMIADLENPTQVARFLGQQQEQGGRFMAVYYNLLLSNPRTVVKKLTSDAMLMMWNAATHKLAEDFGSGAVPNGNTAELLYGYVNAQRDALRIAGRATRTGEFFDPMGGPTDAMPSRAQVLGENAPGAFNMGEPMVASSHWLTAALPTRWIAGADSYATAVQYMGNLRSLLFREGTRQGMDADSLKTFIEQGMDSPPAAIRDQAWAMARSLTFKDPLTGAGAAMQTLVDKLAIPTPFGVSIPVGRIMLPFVKIPYNIAAWSFRNSPLAFMGQEARDAFNAGGATRDLLMARVGLGTSMALGAADLVLSSTLTGQGPHDPELRRAWIGAGNTPYSIRVGDNSYSYQHLEPIGMMLGAIADTYDIMRFAHESDDSEHLAASVALGVGNAVLSKTYMQGISRFFDALHDPEKDGPRWAEGLIDAMVVPSGVNAASRALDSWNRQHQGLLESVQSRIPFLREKLPYQRDMWGRPVPTEAGFLPTPFGDASGSIAADMLSPVTTRPAGQSEPIDKWIWDNRAMFPREGDGRLGLPKPGSTVIFHAGQGVDARVPLDTPSYDRYQELAGNALKVDPRTGRRSDAGMGALDYLNALVAGSNPDGATQREWNRSSPAQQALIVQRVVGKYREAARQQLVQEFPDINDTIAAQVNARQQQLQPDRTPQAIPAGRPGGPMRAPSLGGGP